MEKWRLVPLCLVLTTTLGCNLFNMGTTDASMLNEANEKLEKGQLVQAYDEYTKIAAAHPKNLHAIKGAALAHVLAGEYKKADALLQGYEESAGDKINEIKLRRALVALAALPQDEDRAEDVKKHAIASELPAGYLLAGEVHLFDQEEESAKKMFTKAAEDDGVVGQTAQVYLDLLNAENTAKAGLASASANWALGLRSAACDIAFDSLQELDEGRARAELLLLWAGRSVTSGAPDMAVDLLDTIEDPAGLGGQQWRLGAVKAMIATATGNGKMAAMMFTMLENTGAPHDGVADARATAAALTDDKAIARSLVGDTESASVARSLLSVGAIQAAGNHIKSGTPLSNYIEGLNQ